MMSREEAIEDGDFKLYDCDECGQPYWTDVCGSKYCSKACERLAQPEEVDHDD